MIFITMPCSKVLEENRCLANSIPMYNGEKINELLKEKGIKKKLLCEFLNTSNSGMETIIHGNPTVATIEKVADFFDIPMDVLFNRKRDEIGTKQ